jgi:hypothetical protein
MGPAIIGRFSMVKKNRTLGATLMPIQGSNCTKSSCSASTGICESMTFGSGRINFDGYWEFPCAECARAFEKLHPEYAPCWPFPGQFEDQTPTELTRSFEEGLTPMDKQDPDGDEWVTDAQYWR